MEFSKTFTKDPKPEPRIIPTVGFIPWDLDCIYSTMSTHTPTGCHVVLVSNVFKIRYGSCVCLYRANFH